MNVRESYSRAKRMELCFPAGGNAFWWRICSFRPSLFGKGEVERRVDLEGVLPRHLHVGASRAALRVVASRALSFIFPLRDTGPIGYSDSAGKPKKCHFTVSDFHFIRGFTV